MKHLCGSGRIQRPAVSPDQLVGRGLKRLVYGELLKEPLYRPINWSGAD